MKELGYMNWDIWKEGINPYVLFFARGECYTYLEC